MNFSSNTRRSVIETNCLQTPNIFVLCYAGHDLTVQHHAGNDFPTPTTSKEIRLIIESGSILHTCLLILFTRLLTEAKLSTVTEFISTQCYFQCLHEYSEKKKRTKFATIGYRRFQMFRQEVGRSSVRPGLEH